MWRLSGFGYRHSLPRPALACALRDPSTPRPRQPAEYLTDNVLVLEPPRIQQCLRQTSVLTRLSAGLCDEVTGWQDSQSILLFLERSGISEERIVGKECVSRCRYRW